jgi:hypothetical protein
MDKVDYLEEANRQLTDERFYKKLDSDPTEEFSTKITQELKIMNENSHINKNTFDYLKPDKPKKVVFLLGFGIHELFSLNLGRGISLSSFESDDPSTGHSLSLAEKTVGYKN